MPISDIVNAVSSSYTVWRTLRGVEPLCRNGRAQYITGNAAVIFTVKHEGRLKMLKCYTRHNPYLKDIYGPLFHPRELCVMAITGDMMWVDCLLYDRIEGDSLDQALCQTQSAQDIEHLARAFDQMAYRLLSEGKTHGDLKPENIIVTPSAEMLPIDFDSAFMPAFAGKKSVETGTAAYQHPARDLQFFDAHIDDYSIAIISTLLHAAVIDYSIVEYFRQTQEFPLLPRNIIAGKCADLDAYIEEFARRGDAVHYRIAKMLKSPWPRLFNLKHTLSFSQTGSHAAAIENASLEHKNGLWGCRNTEGWIIPPLYDSGFDPTEGFMVASLGGYTHLIDIARQSIAHTFDKGITAKPVKSGEITIRDTAGTRHTIALKELF